MVVVRHNDVKKRCWQGWQERYKEDLDGGNKAKKK
jgi:hypothetical protein